MVIFTGNEKKFTDAILENNFAFQGFVCDVKPFPPDFVLLPISLLKNV